MFKMFMMLPWKVKTSLLLGVFFILINVLIQLTIPIFISQFIKMMTVTSENSETKIVLFNTFTVLEGSTDVVYKQLLVLLIILIISAVTTSMASVVATTHGSENCSEFFRNKFFSKVQKLSLRDISKITVESLMTRVSNDIAQYWEFLVLATSSLVRAPLLIVGGIVFALLTDLTLSTSIIIILPLMVIVTIAILHMSKPLMYKNQVILDQITKEVDENILGARIIKAYNLQEIQHKKFLEVNQKWINNQKKINNIFSFGDPFFFALINLAVVVVYGISGHALSNNSLTAEDLANINIFIDYAFQISFGVLIFSQFLIVAFRAKVSSKRILEVIEYPVEEFENKNGIYFDSNDKFSIEFKDFNFKYFENSKEYVLKDINFKVEPNSVLGIIGPTGSGKSTIANLLMSNYEYKEGSIKIANKEVKEINTVNLRDNVNIVYQEALLYSGTVKSNIMFSKPNATEEEFQKAVKNSAASDIINTFTERENRKVEQRGKNFSGGQKQRISIARTLLMDPKVLILDDSTSALDEITAKKIVQNIKNNYSCTTIIISQKISSIKNADKIIIMDKGQIASIGTHQELLESNIWYKELNKNQLEQ
ncbi:ABC transporter ATP-binding protein [Mycoplasmopsis ciconiae]|uniref:ABC transporter ATP-binding protein n=1 Tax=Mycoplasmopsis ciconiae TaxID=561067 RepID=A0ABU7MNE4_9BACT|nr:ABC transporter ATP-binding protein [Mycoplasmopsis ciconiae]